MNQAISPSDYLVEMKLAPAASVPTPNEGIAFTERFVLPTLDAFAKLAAAGRIRAGGPAAGTMNFAFIARAASPQEVEELVTSLPLWPRAQTTIVALGTFEGRAAAVRRRLAATKTARQENVPATN